MSDKTLRGEIQAGKGPPHIRTEGGTYRFSRKALLEWLAQGGGSAERSA